MKGGESGIKADPGEKYEVSLTAKGIPMDRIRKYGVAFKGKKVLIGVLASS